MSRVSKEKVDIKKLTKYTIENDCIIVEGNLGSNRVTIPAFLSVEVIEADKVLSVNFIQVKNEEKSKEQAAMHGTVVRLIKNAVIGVTDGFKKRVVFQGLGYRYVLSEDKKTLTMSLGYSHPVIFAVPAAIKIVGIKHDKFEAGCHNKEELGKFSAALIRLRKWNPYSSKGIREEDSIPYTKAVVKAKK